MITFCTGLIRLKKYIILGDNADGGINNDTTVKKKKKKKKIPKQQTNPPTIPISQLFSNDAFPHGEEVEYPADKDG